MSIQENQQEIIDEFSKLTKWEDKYKSLIKMGKNLEKYPEELKDDKFIIKGCQSMVWLHAKSVNGRIILSGESDAMIVKGLLALLLRVFNNSGFQECMSADTNFISELGLNVHLSQSRSNGLASMIKQIKLYAMAFYTLEQQKEL